MSQNFVSILDIYKEKSKSSHVACKLCNKVFVNAVEHVKHFQLAHLVDNKVALQDGRMVDLHRFCIEFGQSSNPQVNSSPVEDVLNERSKLFDARDKGKRIGSYNYQPSLSAMRYSHRSLLSPVPAIAKRNISPALGMHNSSSLINWNGLMNNPTKLFINKLDQPIVRAIEIFNHHGEHKEDVSGMDMLDLTLKL